ncbi:hypothetical protein Goari_016117, partial [Gossypium aridum]|nr:hypothetical protein [Gossypium aridum]
MKESLISILPMLDGSNYAYWKACMMVFIKFMDEKEFRRISKCTTTQKAWIIFEIAYERISTYNDKLVHKVPKSLLEHFFVNMTTINEAKDINTMKIDELI